MGRPGHGHDRAGRSVLAEDLGVDGVEGAVVGHVGEKDRGLHHVRPAHLAPPQQRGQVGERLARLGLEPAGHEHRAVGALLDADLSRAHEPGPGADRRRIGPDRSTHELPPSSTGHDDASPAANHAAAATAAKTVSPAGTGGP